MAAINVFCTGNFRFSKYKMKNSMTTVIKKSITMLRIALSAISNKPEPENKIRKPAPIETRFAKNESRKALPALLYFIMIIVNCFKYDGDDHENDRLLRISGRGSSIKQIEIHGGCFAKDKRNWIVLS